MASITPQREWLADFAECFSPAERQAMINDDINAGTSVSMLLASVIGIGVLLAIVSVVYTLL